MNKRIYVQPEMRVVELRHQAALLAGSGNAKQSVNTMSSSEGFDYVNSIDDDYNDN